MVKIVTEVNKGVWDVPVTDHLIHLVIVVLVASFVSATIRYCYKVANKPGNKFKISKFLTSITLGLLFGFTASLTCLYFGLDFTIMLLVVILSSFLGNELLLILKTLPKVWNMIVKELIPKIIKKIK